ncbi:hypothetical protein [Haloarchaeobius sp. DYHT-AS-18]|uniref:hypothetical protein n=1 Tax=Haloarchaeobius sp. DYHT-AS-18 TaxID=3446117 RepID=UPI003EBE6E40
MKTISKATLIGSAIGVVLLEPIGIYAAAAFIIIGAALHCWYQGRQDAEDIDDAEAARRAYLDGDIT